MPSRRNREATAGATKATRTLTPTMHVDEISNVTATLIIDDEVESDITPRRVTAMETLDIIDLTEDSPSSQRFRTPRRRTNLSRESADSDIVVVESDVTSQNVQPASAVINETICIDDVNEKDTEELSAPAQLDSFTEEPRIVSCPICFEPLKSEIEPMITTCGHMYCKKCLEIISKNMKKCSICQRPIKLKNCITVHFL